MDVHNVKLSIAIILGILSQNLKHNQNPYSCGLLVTSSSSKSSISHGVVKPLELWSSNSSVCGTLSSIGWSLVSPSMLRSSSSSLGLCPIHGWEESDESLANAYAQLQIVAHINKVFQPCRQQPISFLGLDMVEATPVPFTRWCTWSLAQNTNCKFLQFRCFWSIKLPPLAWRNVGPIMYGRNLSKYAIF